MIKCFCGYSCRSFGKMMVHYPYKIHQDAVKAKYKECQLCINIRKVADTFKECKVCPNSICIMCFRSLTRKHCPYCRTPYNRLHIERQITDEEHIEILRMLNNDYLRTHLITMREYFDMYIIQTVSDDESDDDESV